MGSIYVVADIVTPHNAVTKAKEKSNFSEWSSFFIFVRS